MCHKCAKVVKKLCQHILILSSNQFSKRRNCDKLNHWHHQVLKIRFILRHFEVFVLDGTLYVLFMWRVPKMTQKFIAWGVFATHKQATDGATFYSGSQLTTHLLIYPNYFVLFVKISANSKVLSVIWNLINTIFEK